jgi:hypothetical protein
MQLHMAKLPLLLLLLLLPLLLLLLQNRRGSVKQRLCA